jgi:hypothetical protein
MTVCKLPASKAIDLVIHNSIAFGKIFTSIVEWMSCPNFILFLSLLGYRPFSLFRHQSNESVRL